MAQVSVGEASRDPAGDPTHVMWGPGDTAAQRCLLVVTADQRLLRGALSAGATTTRHAL